jgi:hypothetical protein
MWPHRAGVNSVRGMHKIAGSRSVGTFSKRARNGMYAYVPVCTCTYWHVLDILVCTSTYQYILVHTSTYEYVSVQTSTSFSIAALFCGRHDMVQGSTDNIMKCHDIAHTDRYRQKPTCTYIRQEYRILREWQCTDMY